MHVFSTSFAAFFVLTLDTVFSARCAFAIAGSESGVFAGLDTVPVVHEEGFFALGTDICRGTGGTAFFARNTGGSGDQTGIGAFFAGGYTSVVDSFEEFGGAGLAQVGAFAFDAVFGALGAFRSRFVGEESNAAVFHTSAHTVDNFFEEVRETFVAVSGFGAEVAAGGAIDAFSFGQGAGVRGAFFVTFAVGEGETFFAFFTTVVDVEIGTVGFRLTFSYDVVNITADQTGHPGEDFHPVLLVLDVVSEDVGLHSIVCEVDLEVLDDFIGKRKLDFFAHTCDEGGHLHDDFVVLHQGRHGEMDVNEVGTRRLEIQIHSVGAISELDESGRGARVDSDVVGEVSSFLAFEDIVNKLFDVVEESL